MRISRLMYPLLAVPALVFEALVRTRGLLYTMGTFHQERIQGPVISVGNLTLGGAGKTPLVIHIAQRLRTLGVTPALLSRGYGRRSSGSLVFAPEDGIARAAEVVGDEPALVRRHVPEIWVGVAARRVKPAREILQRARAPVFILDDGFQHRKLHRDLDILIIDGMQPLDRNRMFPWGSLREPLNSMKRAQAIVLNQRCPGGADHERIVNNLHPDVPIIHCSQAITKIVPFPQWATADGDVPRLNAAPVFLVAAIGNPERFQRDVENLGIRVNGKRFFRDHLRINDRQWERCAADARKLGSELLLTTEKDAIKLVRPPSFPLAVAVQCTEITETEVLDRLLRSVLQSES